MEHSSQLIDLVNSNGEVVGQKPRKDINKKIDLYHSVHTLLITPTGEIVFTAIPTRDDLPNIYAGQLGVTAATMRRTDETSDHASIRSLSRELFIDGAEVHHLGDSYIELLDGHHTYLSAYYLIGTAPRTFSATDSEGFVTVSAHDFRHQLTTQPSKFALTMQAFWSLYRDQLPV